MFNSMWLYVTEGCNLRCPYCFNPDALFTRKGTIDEAAYRDIIDNFLMYHEAAGNTVTPQIVLFGGEPTLYPDLLDGIMAYGRRRTEGRIRFLLITNGTRIVALADRIRRWRSEHQLRIQLSVDGDPHYETPRVVGVNAEAYRDKVEGAFDFLVSEGVPFTIRGTLTPKHIDRYASNFEYFVSVFARADLTPNVTIMPDFIYANWGEDEYRRIGEQARSIVAYIEDRYEATGTLVRDVFVDRALRSLHNDALGVKREGDGSVCGFSGGLCGVGPTGETFACHRVYGESAMRIGNMRTGEINHAKREAINAVVNSRRFARPAAELPFDRCEECDIGSNCQAICPADSFVAQGTKPELRCNAVLYHFQKIFKHAVAESLWPRIEREPALTEAARRAYGIRTPEPVA